MLQKCSAVRWYGILWYGIKVELQQQMSFVLMLRRFRGNSINSVVT